MAIHCTLRKTSNALYDTFWEKQYCLDAGTTMMQWAAEECMCQCKTKHYNSYTEIWWFFSL